MGGVCDTGLICAVTTVWSDPIRSHPLSVWVYINEWMIFGTDLVCAMTAVSIALLIPSVLVPFPLNLAQSCHPSPPPPPSSSPPPHHSAPPAIPLLACLVDRSGPRHSARLSLSPLAISDVTPSGWHVSLSPRERWASCPRWPTAAERVEPDRASHSTRCSPLTNAAGRLVDWQAACHSNHS